MSAVFPTLREFEDALGDEGVGIDTWNGKRSQPRKPKMVQKENLRGKMFIPKMGIIYLAFQYRCKHVFTIVVRKTKLTYIKSKSKRPAKWKNTMATLEASWGPFEAEPNKIHTNIGTQNSQNACFYFSERRILWKYMVSPEPIQYLWEWIPATSPWEFSGNIHRPKNCPSERILHNLRVPKNGKQGADLNTLLRYNKVGHHFI